MLLIRRQNGIPLKTVSFPSRTSLTQQQECRKHRFLAAWVLSTTYISNAKALRRHLQTARHAGHEVLWLYNITCLAPGVEPENAQHTWFTRLQVTTLAASAATTDVPLTACTCHTPAAQHHSVLSNPPRRTLRYWDLMWPSKE